MRHRAAVAKTLFWREIMIDGDVQKELKTAFEQLPHSIPLHLFVGKSADDPFSRAAREMIKAFGDLSKKIVVTIHDMDDPLAAKWGVTVSPTFVFDPERTSIRYMGVPYGEEGRTMLGILILVGLRAGNLSEQSLSVLKKLDERREVKIFVSATCPYCPDQALNAVKAAIERPDLVSVEIIDTQSNPELANQYSAFSVPQTFANEVLIAQGAQTEELFMLSLQKLEQQTLFIPDVEADEIDTDVVIVGGGPSGLTAGIYTVRSGLRTAVIERGPLGGQVALTPLVENYPGFTRVPGKTLVDILVSHALEYVQIFQGEDVLEIRPGSPMEVLTSRRRFKTRAVVLATGASYKHLDIPGETRLAGRGVSYCATCDGQLFKGKKVIVVGGGNSAVTEVLYLRHIGVDVTLVHRRDALRAQEHLTRDLAVNEIPVLWNTVLTEIHGTQRVSEVTLYNTKTGETSTMAVDGVFIAIGYMPNVDLASRSGVEIDEDGFIKHDMRHRTNVPGVYSAGDVEGGFKQIVTAMGQGTEAALSVYEDLAHPYWSREGASQGVVAARA